MNAPLAGLAQHLAGPGWARDLMALARRGGGAGAAAGSTYAAMATPNRCCSERPEGTLPRGLALLHARFGTPARAIDMTVIATILVIVATGGRVRGLARAYVCAIAGIVC